MTKDKSNVTVGLQNIIEIDELAKNSEKLLGNISNLSAALEISMQKTVKEFNREMTKTWTKISKYLAKPTLVKTKKLRVPNKPNLKLRFCRKTIISDETRKMPAITIGVFCDAINYAISDNYLSQFNITLDDLLSHPMVKIRHEYEVVYTKFLPQINQLNLASLHLSNNKENILKTCHTFDTRKLLPEPPKKTVVDNIISRHSTRNRLLFYVSRKSVEISKKHNEILRKSVDDFKMNYNRKNAVLVSELKQQNIQDGGGYSLNPVNIFVRPKPVNEVLVEGEEGYLFDYFKLEFRHYKNHTYKGKGKIAVYIRSKKSTKGSHSYYPFEYLKHNANFNLAPEFYPVVGQAVKFVNTINSSIKTQQRDTANSIRFLQELDKNNTDFNRD